MRTKILNLILFCAVFVFCGCTKVPKTDYLAIMQKNPKSILVVMPINETTEVKAGNSVLSNVVMPLSEAGYYVFPVTAVNETFKNNGIIEAGEIHRISPQKLYEIFGADAVLYLNVTEYGTSYKIITSKMQVAMEAKLVALPSGVTLWQKSAVADDGSMDGGHLIFNMLVAPLIQQIFSTLTDKSYTIAQNASFMLLGQDCADCLPYGELSPNFRQDKQFK